MTHTHNGTTYTVWQGSPGKIRDEDGGGWGAWVQLASGEDDAKPAANDIVVITTRSGKQWASQIDAALWQGATLWLVKTRQLDFPFDIALDGQGQDVQAAAKKEEPALAEIPFSAADDGDLLPF